MIASPLQLGFAVTRHCNLRCPHCIRDDVQSVASLDAALFERILDEAGALFGDVAVSLTGGEPLLHPRFRRLVEILGERGVPWRMVSNGWHLGRALAAMERHPPRYVRLSLSGGDEATHDAERGRGSFRRVLLGVGILGSRGMPAGLTFVIDRRDRHQLRAVADLAEALGAAFLEFILPQPVPASAVRRTDLEPGEWFRARREVEELAAEGRRTRVVLAYGAPSLDGPEPVCRTKQLQRLTVDVEGRVALCCQMSEYGGNATEVVADLKEVSLEEAWALHVESMARLRAEVDAPDVSDPLAPFPCMRCARRLGKLDWLADHPPSPWRQAAGIASRALPVLRAVPA